MHPTFTGQIAAQHLGSPPNVRRDHERAVHPQSG
jgi:hypothetical protein